MTETFIKYKWLFWTLLIFTTVISILANYLPLAFFAIAAHYHPIPKWQVVLIISIGIPILFLPVIILWGFNKQLKRGAKFRKLYIWVLFLFGFVWSGVFAWLCFEGLELYKYSFYLGILYGFLSLFSACCAVKYNAKLQDESG